ncbi:MAG TPA: patatin-like phospholipase family protein [Streptosporangiaceae bacterium]|nr:patatin-like phospholipase family protein [Streptosporangiaceae bacterium]
MTVAVVFGAGGVAGIAWEAGMVLGLQQAGVDLYTADLVVGTSAGSIVGSHVASRSDLRTLLERQESRAAGAPAAPPPDLDTVLAALAPLFDAELDPLTARRRVGAAAVTAPAGDEAAHIRRITALLPAHQEWPQRRLLVASVDTGTGELAVWHRDSGVPLPRAVAASCAVPGVYPPVTIGGHRYMDGGIRSATNADLAEGASTVIVLNAIGHLVPTGSLEAELAKVGAARTWVVSPDARAAEAMGANVLDAATWAPALAAGLAQAESCAEAAGAVWSPAPG